MFSHDFFFDQTREHPLVCRKRPKNFSDETGKTEVLCHSRCGTTKISPCSNALGAEHRPDPSPAVSGDVSIQVKILEQDVNSKSIKQSFWFIIIKHRADPIKESTSEGAITT
jgi:hypothetical protein